MQFETQFARNHTIFGKLGKVSEYFIKMNIFTKKQQNAKH